MKRIGLVLLTAIVFSVAGFVFHGLTNPRQAEARWAAAAPTPVVTGSGGAIGVSGPQSITGPLSITGPSGGVAMTAQGTGTGLGATCIGGGTDPGGNHGAAGISGRGGSAGGNGGRFFGTSAYAGVWAENNSDGRAAVFDGDADGTRATILIMAQNATPSAAAVVGDVFVCDGSAGCGGVAGMPYVATATTPTFNPFSGMLPPVTGITAFAGGGQASATVVCTTANHTSVDTVASAGDSVKFPATPVLGQRCEVKNNTATSLNLFPGSGDQLCNSGSACAAADAALPVAARVELHCRARTAAIWDCK